jgi:hypothetical protein
VEPFEQVYVVPKKKRLHRLYRYMTPRATPPSVDAFYGAYHADSWDGARVRRGGVRLRWGGLIFNRAPALLRRAFCVVRAPRPKF